MFKEKLKDQMSDLTDTFAVKDPIINITFSGLNAGSKAVPKADFDLDITNRDIATSTQNGRTFITRFRDPRTGYYVMNTPATLIDPSKYVLVNAEFSKLVQLYLQEAWIRKYRELEKFKKDDSEKYQKDYRDLDLLDRYITKQLSNLNTVAEMVIKKARTYESRIQINVNQKLVYANQKITAADTVTTRLPYNKPQIVGLEINNRKFKRIKAFLDPFLDEDNFYTFLWYFGALLANASGDSVSKMLVVSSSKGGNGKNTFIEGICHGLFTPPFYDVKPTFDEYFTKGNRFAASQLFPVHVVVFGEAEWNSDPHSSDHDLSGMSIDRLKSVISDGIYTSEAKFATASSIKAPFTRFIVLTNHFPVVTDDNEALNRRLLPLVLKPSTMAEKGIELGLTSRQAFFDACDDIAPDLADVCYSFYEAYPHLYDGSKYNRNEAVRNIQETATEYQEQAQNGLAKIRQLARTDQAAAIIETGHRKGLDLSRLADEVKKGNPNKNYVKWDLRMNRHNCYVNASTNALLSITGTAAARAALKEVFGNPVKKAGMRMFRIC